MGHEGSVADHDCSKILLGIFKGVSLCGTECKSEEKLYDTRPDEHASS